MSLRDLLEEPKLALARSVGTYHRWHKLYTRYCIYNVDDVDFDILYLELAELTVKDGRAIYYVRPCDMGTISQPALYPYREDWVLWDMFLNELQGRQHNMDMFTVLRLMAMVSVLKGRRKGDAEKKRCFVDRVQRQSGHGER